MTIGPTTKHLKRVSFVLISYSVALGRAYYLVLHIVQGRIFKYGMTLPITKLYLILPNPTSVFPQVTNPPARVKSTRSSNDPTTWPYAQRPTLTSVSPWWNVKHPVIVWVPQVLDGSIQGVASAWGILVSTMGIRTPSVRSVWSNQCVLCAGCGVLKVGFSLKNDQFNFF